MSEQSPGGPAPPAAGGSGPGWFSFAPVGPRAPDDEDPVVRVVRLREHEHAGPFWDDEGHLSDDFDELHRWIGISRGLFDDAVAWNEELASQQGEPSAAWTQQHLTRREELLRRLGQEVHPGIEVDLSDPGR